MNRPLFCIILLSILLLIGQTALAEKLYRWVEPDGSITFSPTPPPAGVDYKPVNAAHNNAGTADLPVPKADLTAPEADFSTAKSELSETELSKTEIGETQLSVPNADVTIPNQKPSILATSEHGLDASQPINNATQIMARPAPVEERQKLSYAPDIGSKSRSAQATITAEHNFSEQAIPQTDSPATSHKRRQCQDLNKRVMSLERRLRSPLEPADMDNTVVAMARYQRSYDQHCVE